MLCCVVVTAGRLSSPPLTFPPSPLSREDGLFSVFLSYMLLQETALCLSWQLAMMGFSGKTLKAELKYFGNFQRQVPNGPPGWCVSPPSDQQHTHHTFPVPLREVRGHRSYHSCQKSLEQTCCRISSRMVVPGKKTNDPRPGTLNPVKAKLKSSMLKILNTNQPLGPF